MIGQEYFDVRSRLGTALYALSSLSAETGGDQEHGQILQNLVNSLKDPFVFVVAGEVNVGKSTFLNALFGDDFSRTGVVPTTDKIYFFKHGPTVRHVPISRTLEEVYVPAEFLRDFHIVDTPGTNSVESEHQEITERFVPMADLVIFVFSAMNPWGASAWQFLDKVHKHWMRNVIFVLQQCDLRSAEEIDAILQYMRQLCRQRYERDFPIYPVSAKKAYLSRSSGIDRERLLAESGFENLERDISRSLGTAGARIGKMANALRISGDILAGMRLKSQGRSTTREEKSTALEAIENSLHSQEERSAGKLAPAVEATGSEFARVSDLLVTYLRSLLTPGMALQSIFKEKRHVGGCDETLLNEVRQPAILRWEHAVSIIEDDVNHSATYFGTAMRHELKVQLKEEVRADAAYWQPQQRRFLDHVKEQLRLQVGGLGIEAEITPVFTQTRSRARWLVFVLLLTLAGAGAAAWQGLWPVAGGVGALGLLICMGLWFANVRQLAETCKAVKDKLTHTRPTLEHKLTAVVKEELHQHYEVFLRQIHPARDKLGEQRLRQASLHDQVINLSRTFEELENDIRELTTQKN